MDLGLLMEVDFCATCMTAMDVAINSTKECLMKILFLDTFAQIVGQLKMTAHAPKMSEKLIIIQISVQVANLQIMPQVQ